MSDRSELAGQAIAVAQLLDDSDPRAFAFAGAVRRCARALLGVDRLDEAEDERRCIGCKAPLSPPKRTGRPRRWCGRGRCVNAAEKSAKTRQ